MLQSTWQAGAVSPEVWVQTSEREPQSLLVEHERQLAGLGGTQ
jgi:hypothetical protein